jgi:hypothetical protein
VAVIDWEFAGFYPQYWEYHKCFYSMDWTSSWITMPKKWKSDLAILTFIRKMIL